MKAFMRQEFTGMDNDDIIDANPMTQEKFERDDLETNEARAKPWTSIGHNAGVTGLTGCVSLIITSREGAYFSHIYEDPAFEGQEPAAQQVEFQTSVLAKLERATNPLGSDSSIPPLDQYIAKAAGNDALFYPGSKPQVLIVVPRNAPYGNYLDQLQTKVMAMLAGTDATIKRVSYIRAMNTPDGEEVYDRTMATGGSPSYQQEIEWYTWLDESPYDKVLLQYSPTGSSTNGNAYAVYVGANSNEQSSDSW